VVVDYFLICDLELFRETVAANTKPYCDGTNNVALSRLQAALWMHEL
jgi:hypothetical protein